MAANGDRSLGTEHFGANVVAVERVAADLNGAKRTACKAQGNHGVINITDLGQLLAYQERAFRGYALHLAAHEPAGEVKIMDSHIDNQPAAQRGVRVLGPGAE